MSALTLGKRSKNRQRELVTPEGLNLPITLASRGSRAGALILDLVVIAIIQITVTLILIGFGISLFSLENVNGSPALEFVAVIWIIAMFLFHYGYFLFFELGPRGATPGKRMTGIRIAARDGGQLSVEAVIARNLLRDVEVFLPLAMLSSAGLSAGLASITAAAWFLIFLLFPFFNRDRLRAGDIIAGTWVVDVPKRNLEDAMSLSEASRGHSVATGAQYRFGDAELGIYGELELQTLERILRDGNEDATVMVAQTICTKIGWEAGAGDEKAFLEAFYAQLRAKLERDMRFGTRKADKHT